MNRACASDVATSGSSAVLRQSAGRQQDGLFKGVRILRTGRSRDAPVTAGVIVHVEEFYAPGTYRPWHRDKRQRGIGCARPAHLGKRKPVPATRAGNAETRLIRHLRRTPMRALRCLPGEWRSKAASDHRKRYAPRTFSGLLRIEAFDQKRFARPHAWKVEPAASVRVSKASGINFGVVRVTYGRAAFSVVPVSQQIVAREQAIADEFAKLGIIPKRINVSAAVLPIGWA
jgi:hypothetical protein